jgi:hypothetical protein
VNVDASTLGGLGASGAVVVLCWLVIGELRALRPVFTDLRNGMADLRQGLGDVREVLSALLERDRIRASRSKDSAPPVAMPKAAATISPAESWDESTDLHEIVERQRRERTRSPARGVRLPRPGTFHDKDD